MLWLPATEVQDSHQTGTLISLSKITDIPSDHLEDIDNFKNVEHENHTFFKALTRNLDDL